MKAFVDHVSDKKRSGSEMLNSEWDNTIFFSLQQRELYQNIQQSIFPIKIASETTFFVQIYWEILNRANLCSWTFGQSETSDLSGACVLMCAVGEKDFGFWQEMFTAMITNKKDDNRGDWGSDYWWQHLWNARDIDVRTVKPRRIPPAPPQRSGSYKIEIVDLMLNERSLTRGPKGHISCTWVQSATFLRNQRRRTFLLTDRPDKHKLGRGLWDLASC